MKTKSSHSLLHWIFSITLVIIPVICAYCFLSFRYYLDKHFPIDTESIYWDWSTINVSDTHFPPDFLWGTATAAHQTEGNSFNNQWYEFETANQSRILNNDVSGVATDHWNLYSHDIDLMKNDLHVNAYRFSIEWSKIEPQKGVYNRTAINHYHALIDELIAKKIEPMLTIHHFTNPLWFKQLGDFEKSENIHHLVDFARFAFTEFKQVKKWCTINEPNVYATEGYIMGHFPPGKTDVKLAFEVIKNMAEAHVQMYKMIKSLPGGKDATVGVVLQLSQVHPSRMSNPLDRMLAAIATAVSPGLHLDFFSTGAMSLYVPLYCNLRYENKEAIHSNDFIGLNYYTHDVIQFKFGIPPYTLVKDKDAKYSDMNWLLFPEGIYHAIRTLAKRFGKKIPIIVTENGIADRSDVNRKEFFERYLYAVSRAIKEGYNVKGYTVWSLMDNFEWAHGFHPRFGLYEVDYKTQQRRLRQGAKPFVDTIRKWENSLL